MRYFLNLESLPMSIRVEHGAEGGHWLLHEASADACKARFEKILSVVN